VKSSTSLSLNSKMSSTLRLYLNDDRISTAVKTKTGGILQVYPVKTNFTDEVTWRAHWDEAMKPKIVLRISPVVPARAPVTALPVAAPVHASLENWTVTKQKNSSFTLPAGTYYIGDLCYVLGNDVYDKVFGGTGYSSGIYKEKTTDNTFAMSVTAWGDGQYEGSDGKMFLVDAGIIGICSASLMAKNDGGGHVYTFDEPVTCRFQNGRFAFDWGYRSLMIDTD
jgi:hypothetical protein